VIPSVLLTSLPEMGFNLLITMLMFFFCIPDHICPCSLVKHTLEEEREEREKKILLLQYQEK